MNGYEIAAIIAASSVALLAGALFLHTVEELISEVVWRLAGWREHRRKP